MNKISEKPNSKFNIFELEKKYIDSLGNNITNISKNLKNNNIKSLI